MPQSDYFVRSTPVLLTANDVTALRINNRGGRTVRLQATVGATPPSSWEGGIELQPGQTLVADMPLSVLFPGVSGANRVYAVGDAEPTVLGVSHV